MSLDDYIKKFKFLCDKLAAIKKPMDDTNKVFTFARGLGLIYKDFRTAMLSKAPYPTFNQFISSLKAYEQLNQLEPEITNNPIPDMHRAFYTQQGRGRGR